MTSPARQTAAPRDRPADVDHLLATGMLMLLTAITSVSLCRVFDGWDFLPTLLVVGAVLHLASLLLRILRVPALVAIPILILVFVEVIAIIFYSDTLRLGLPSGDTIRLMRLDLRLVWGQFPTAVAPVPSEGSFLVAASYGIGLVAMFSDAFAFRAYGRAEAVVPAGVLFVFTAALGTDRNRVTVAAAWFAVAVGVVAVLRALHGTGSDAWLGRRRRAVAAALPATAMCAAVAALGAAMLGPLMPGAGSAPLLDTRQSQSDSSQVLSPLVDIRSRLVNRSNTEMFTVDSAVGRYWRVTGLTVFNGEQWQLPEQTVFDASGLLTAESAAPEIVQQQVTISRFGGTLIPLAFRPVSVSQSGLGWLAQTDTLVVSEPLRTGAVYNMASDIGVPSPEALAQATASMPPMPSLLDLPSDLPDEIADTAAAVVAGATSPYGQARALQDWFRTNFTYDLTVQRGHDEDAITSFLRIRRGYCEQFAGTFAVMARAVGLPSRVAVGFTQGELRADGKYHVLGRNAHAWPEVWFDGIGWVAFEPTPGRGAPGSEAITGAAPAQDERTGTNGNGTTDTAVPTTTTPTTPTTERDPLGTGSSTPSTIPAALAGSSGDSGGGFGLVGWVLAALAAIGAWAYLMPGVVRRFTRVGSSPSEQVIAAWHGSVGTLQLAGAPPQGAATPLEYARVVERETGIDGRSLTELARFVTRAVYAPDGVREPAALRAAVLRTHLDETATELMPWPMRLWSRIDPRLARQRLVGDLRRRSQG
jgi:hypothetical protein